ncbi:MAG: LysR family transcriptional regulator [Hyphomonas sp.]|nr:LysR family transcriptional regulator [Hyphomonas sp.]
MPNNHSLPQLDDLSVFLAVSRAGGFRKAARWLSLSPSTVSETITRLEARLGVPLFNRTTRSVQLTEAGRALAERLEPVMAEARAAIDDAASSQGIVRGRLKLNVPGAVMVDILPPLIDSFLRTHPEVQVEILVEDSLVDIIAKGCDAGIRYGEHLAQDMIAVPIGPRTQQAAFAASPAYIAARGMPKVPKDLLAHSCIRQRFTSGHLIEWEVERDGTAKRIDPPARLILGTGSPATALGHAVAGHGIIQTFRNWLDPYFGDGSLVPVLTDWWPEFSGPQLYFPRRFSPAPLRAFLDHLATERKDKAA